jgi:hypothetical protein
MKVDYKVYKYSEDGFLEALNTDSFQQSIDCWSASRNSSWGPYIVAECDAKTQVLNSTESIREWSRWLMLHGYNRIERRIMKDMKEMKAMEVVEPEDKEMSFTEEMPELMGKVFGGLAPEEVDRLSKLNLDSIPRTKSKVSEGSAFKAAWDELDHQEQDAIINPAHYKMIPAEAYKKYPEGLEYMDLMEYILAHHKGIEGHLLGQVFKYACRLGRKDAMGQDAKKIQWYATRLAKVINEGDNYKPSPWPTLGD